MLAVERIKEIEVTDSGFIYPADFDPEELLESAFGLFFDDPITVKVRFPAEQARYIEERCWAKDQKITRRRDGAIVLKMTTSGWYDVKRWILSFGPVAELLEPADKSEAAREMAGLYDEKTKNPSPRLMADRRGYPISPAPPKRRREKKRRGRGGKTA